MDTNLVTQLAELAELIEMGDPIDWGMLELDEHATYQLMANQVFEYYASMKEDQREIMLLSTVVKLVVENFVLNSRLLKQSTTTP
jgi:hypothetical protein